MDLVQQDIVAKGGFSLAGKAQRGGSKGHSAGLPLIQVVQLEKVLAQNAILWWGEAAHE